MGDFPLFYTNRLDRFILLIHSLYCICGETKKKPFLLFYFIAFKMTYHTLNEIYMKTNTKHS